MSDPRTPDQRVIRGSSCFPLDRTALVARCELRTWTVGFRTFRPSRLQHTKETQA